MQPERFIDIRKLIASKNPNLLKWLPGFIVRYLERILHQDEINQFIIDHKHLYNEDFCQAIVSYFNIQTEIRGIHNLPKTGPIIIAMNHPLGGMDAIALVAALKNHRRDIKFIVNDLLLNMENLRELFVGVNKHGKNEGSTRDKIEKAFQAENVLCIFPAGLVSRKTKGQVRDLEWKKTFVSYARKLNQPIIPIHINGELSNFFYRLSNFRKFIGIKANIEMLYLADELFKQRNKQMIFTIGESIYADKTSSSDKEMTKQIYNLIYTLPKTEK